MYRKPRHVHAGNGGGGIASVAGGVVSRHIERLVAVIVPATLLLVGTGCASTAKPGGAMTKPAEATTKTSDATTSSVPRAQGDDAASRADQVDARVSRLWASRHRRTVVETIHVHFRTGGDELDQSAHAALDTLATEMSANDGLVADIEGYTDTTGTREQNVELSRRRAEGVRLYLVEHGVELSRVHAIGRGPLADPDVPAEQKRRVTIKVLAPSE